MKKITLAFAILMIALLSTVYAQHKTEPWKTDQLVAPEELAKVLTSNTTEKPFVISIGPSALIKGSADAGPAQEEENLKHLKKLVSDQPKNKEIIIYCGCCPFEKCPNIRPAFALLKEMKFTNQKLLNLSHNLKVDWIDKGFPINEN